jgi:hypothetical protein
MALALEHPEAGVGGFQNEEALRIVQQHRAERERLLQSLNLQRENILSQRTSSPARRTALEAALAQIEAQIQAVPSAPTIKSE